MEAMELYLLFFELFKREKGYISHIYESKDGTKSFEVLFDNYETVKRAICVCKAIGLT